MISPTASDAKRASLLELSLLHWVSVAALFQKMFSVSERNCKQKRQNHFSELSLFLAGGLIFQTLLESLQEMAKDTGKP